MTAAELVERCDAMRRKVAAAPPIPEAPAYLDPLASIRRGVERAFDERARRQQEAEARHRAEAKAARDRRADLRTAPLTAAQKADRAWDAELAHPTGRTQARMAAEAGVGLATLQRRLYCHRDADKIEVTPGASVPLRNPNGPPYMRHPNRYAYAPPGPARARLAKIHKHRRMVEAAARGIASPAMGDTAVLVLVDPSTALAARLRPPAAPRSGAPPP